MIRLWDKAIRAVRASITGKKHSGLRIGMWHEFHKPPYGGGNQFYMALKKEFKKRHIDVSLNSMSSLIDVHLCNFVWFDANKFEKASRKRKLKMVHRVDGPTFKYRGSDRSVDDRNFELNRKYASATVCQSDWALKELRAEGYEPVMPVVIHNAVDGDIFNSDDKVPFSRERKVRIVASAWSDNPRKGGPLFKWMDTHLDWNKYEFTFVGRVQQSFDNIKIVPPQPSESLADILRQNDVYIMASRQECCSNAVIEALSCGLPVLYIDDAGNRELVKKAGLPFMNEDEAILQLEKLIADYEKYKAAISVKTISQVADMYLDVMHKVLAS